MRRLAWLYIAPTILILIGVLWPLISGSETLYLRDVLTTHYPLKAAQAEALLQGELPLVDLHRAGGQPLLGNPNGLPLYPDNVLLFFASPLWALNAHFWLHLLLAPLAYYWLGRAWGLRRSAAWAAGVCYAASGFMLSLLNLYNLVAGAALAPAFIAAVLDSWQGSRPRRSHVAAALLWTLLLLAGDPLFGAMALAAAGLAGLVRDRRPPRGPIRLVTALVCGTALAAPMLVEFLRILPRSLRGFRSYSAESALLQSWDPRSLIEWLLPLFFGSPDFSFWGHRFYDGLPPLLYSVYPGLLCFVLIPLTLVLLKQRRAPAIWGWLLVALGLFLALGKWNPAVRALYEVPGAATLRYPVKVWLLVALGASLLCGLGFERLLHGDGKKLASRLVALLACCYLVAWVLIGLTPMGQLLRGLDPRRLSGSTFDHQLLIWMGTCLFSLGVLVLLTMALYMVGRRPQLGGALLLAIHLTSQLFFLAPLMDSDEVTPYVRKPELLAQVPQDARLVHGGFKDLFGPQRLNLSSLPFPDLRTHWLTRSHFEQLYPFAGIAWGRRYEFNPSPEGLDSFLTFSLTQILPRMKDAERLQVLEASGVQFLLLDRPLDVQDDQRARLLAQVAIPVGQLHLYKLPRTAEPVQWATTLHQTPHMNATLALMTSPSFDPQKDAVVPGSESSSSSAVNFPLAGEQRTARILSETADEIEIQVDNPQKGFLVYQRTYQDIYRATVDGQPTPLLPANLHRLGIEVPAGSSHIRVWADHNPSRLARLLAGLALIGILAQLAIRPKVPAP